MKVTADFLTVIPAKAGIQGARGEDGFAKFTNEVQRHAKVLPWEKFTTSSPSKSGTKWPVSLDDKYGRERIP